MSHEVTANGRSADRKFNTSEELIEEIRNGRMVILCDDEDRENEGDLVLAADHVNAPIINFMAREARGLICLALASEQIDRLQLPQMVRDDLNDSPNKTAFTVSIEAAEGVTTGISAQDRAHTIRVASSPMAKAADVRMPGHIFPIKAQNGGVLRRAGHTEGSVDLCRLAGLHPAAVICELMNEDGTMSRVPDLFEFAKKHGLKIGTIVDLIEYRLRRENLVEEIFSTELPPHFGDFKARVFKSKVDGVEHLVLQKGEITKDADVLVRVQLDSYSRDLMGFVLNHSMNVLESLKMLAHAPSAVLLLLRGNNRAQGLIAELRSLTGEKPVPVMDERDYGIGAQILRSLGAHKIRLISNKADKRVGLRAYDIEIVDVVPIAPTLQKTQLRPLPDATMEH